MSNQPEFTGTVPQAKRRVLVAVVADDEDDRTALSSALAGDGRHRVVNSTPLGLAEAALARQPADAIVGFVNDEQSWQQFRALARRHPDTLSVLLLSDPDGIDAKVDPPVLNAILALDRADLASRASELATAVEREWNVGGRVVNDLHPAERERLALLSPREVQVLDLTARGLSMKEIATRLKRAYGTVAAHRTNIMEKLDLHDKVALTRFAIRAGLARD